MGGGLPRRWAQSLSNANVPVVATLRTAAASEARRAAAALVDAARRLARSSAERVGDSAGEAVQAAKVLAVRGARSTGAAVARGGGHAAAAIKANAGAVAESLRVRGGAAASQVQGAFSEYSLRFMQAATELAVRVISKQHQGNGQTGERNAVTPISIVTTEPKKTSEDNLCSSKTR